MQISFEEASRTVERHGFVLLGWTEFDFTGQAHVVLNPRDQEASRSMNHNDSLFVLGPTPGRSEGAAFKMKRGDPTTAAPSSAEPQN